MELFGSSGTRGVANETITPTFAADLGRAAAATLDADRVAVGRDTRTSGAMLASAAAAGIVSAGADAERLGVLPTPAVQSYAAEEGVPGLVVTASHNPPRYNGIKLVGTDGGDLPVERLEAVEVAFRDDTAAAAPWDGIGDIREVEGASRRYVEGVVGAVDRERIADADITVALDPGHGAGAHTSPDLFRRLGCTVVTVNAQPDGRFPGREPEPIREHLADLRRLVRSADADLGVAHDGDADRAVFVDEAGEHVQGEASLAALAAADLGAGDVAVAAANVSQRLVDAVEAAGADLELTPVGSTRIVERVRDLVAAGERVPVAGEGNGGVIFPPYGLARDGAYTAARFLELVAERPASGVVAPHADYHFVRDGVPYDGPGEREAILSAVSAYAAESDAGVTTIDGHRLDFGDGWVLARPSGTEPLVRIYAEARDPERARELLEDMRTALPDYRSG